MWAPRCFTAWVFFPKRLAGSPPSLFSGSLICSRNAPLVRVFYHVSFHTSARFLGVLLRDPRHTQPIIPLLLHKHFPVLALRSVPSHTVPSPRSPFPFLSQPKKSIHCIKLTVPTPTYLKGLGWFFFWTWWQKVDIIRSWLIFIIGLRGPWSYF